MFLKRKKPSKKGKMIVGLGALVTGVGRLVGGRMGAKITGFGLAHMFLGTLYMLRPTLRGR